MADFREAHRQSGGDIFEFMKIRLMQRLSTPNAG